MHRNLADEYRAHLITGRKGCHDYINAVICDDYLRPNSFILTQWPLLTTIKDFWRMIYDYGIVSTIVLSQVGTGIVSYTLTKIYTQRLFFHSDIQSFGRSVEGKDSYTMSFQ